MQFVDRRDTAEHISKYVICIARTSRGPHFLFFAVYDGHFTGMLKK